MSFTNPRRSKGFNSSQPSCQKGATFHAPSSSTSSTFVPPSLPQRSQTSLEDVIDGKVRRAALALQDFERLHDASPSSSPKIKSYRDEGIPLPQGLLQNTLPSSPNKSDEMSQSKKAAMATNERKASLRPKRQARRGVHASDSGLGTSIQTKKTAAAARNAPCAINVSAAPSTQKLQSMSNETIQIVNEQILLKLLTDKSLKDFRPLVQDCPRAIEKSEIVCIRDLEKTLILGGPHRAKTSQQYIRFCESLITYIRTALVDVSSLEQTRPQDRPYSPGYFTDLVGQVQQAALRISASREKEAKGEKLAATDARSSDEYKLYGGLTVNGRAAELVRVKNDGTLISMKTNKPLDTDEDLKSHPIKRSDSPEEEDDVLRSMARRKKHLTAEDLAPKLCRETNCGKTFKRACDLTKHEKTHSRPWKCVYEDCRYNKDGWPTEKELLRHQNDRHASAPKMFECIYEGCAYQSKRDSNRKQHMEKAHGYTYVRTKSNGKRKSEGTDKVPSKVAKVSAKHSAKGPIPIDTGIPTPVEQLDDDFENETHDSVMHEQSVYTPESFEEGNGSVQYQGSAHTHDPFEEHMGSVTFGNSPYSHEYPSLEDYSPLPVNNFDMDIEMDLSMEPMPQLHGDFMDSRHNSTDSSVPSPYGSNLLLGFQHQDGNGAFPVNNTPDMDFTLFNTHMALRMQLPDVADYQRSLPDFSNLACSGNEVQQQPQQQISPRGDGDQLLYTPTHLQSVDEGFEDYSGGPDFSLYGPVSNSLESSRVPLFGEVDNSNDLYPSFLNTQECMDMNWDVNSLSQ